ncbi:Glycine-, glutamate-, thienylcyclohexylpiperidine-binding protein [Giardia muris]|uniref:Glycine-, glutamate-, thienylcyclohexylpiperidine-binding protein n=1 Tax=Giardia muris TaxID=5742 RepID=A0A4Z1T296_GIAMU|nr:Glycine-, glutamate-, thienylcyclohexylpiperidine-binding protein [Giardia muris]|eukprot:TNJ28053.1 Glycine-, glutamate-, thienylcyclohexylpiperidine-binding protein [Giardia muris]
MSTLRFVVKSVSSTEAGYPVQNILEGDVVGPGWRSARDCSYPQEIVIEIPQLSQVTMLQYTTHEYLVPSAVELLKQDDLGWSRVGKIEMGKGGTPTNGRERKTAKLNIKATSIRLVLHKPLPHVKNRHGQVGIAAVILHGTPLGKDMDRPAPISSGANSQESRSRGATGAEGMPGGQGKDVISSSGHASRRSPYYDKGEAIRTTLMVQKAEAADSEDFLRAGRLKQAYDQLGVLLATYKQLDRQKEEAKRKEDYAAAHEIKESMAEIEMILDMPIESVVCVMNGEELPKDPTPPRQPAVRSAKNSHDPPVESSMVASDLRDSDVRSNTPYGAQRDEEQSRPAAKSRTRSPKRAPPPPSNGTDYASMVPTIPQGDELNEYGERMIRPRQQEIFALTEEEKAEQDAKYRSRVRDLQRQTALMKSQAASREDLGSSRSLPKNTNMGRSIGRSMGRSQVQKQFVFTEALEQITSNREGPTLPPELPGTVQRGTNATILRTAGFNDIYIRLAYSSSKQHTEDAVKLMTQAIQADAPMFAAASAALVAIISESTNTALLGSVMQLFCYTYVAYMRKEMGMPPLTSTGAANNFDDGDLKLVFPDVTGKLATQKENAVTYAKLQCRAEIFVKEKLKHNMAQFHNDILSLLTPILTKLSDSQRRTRMVALNMLATVSSFLFFPAVAFVSALISRRALERASGLAQAELALVNSKLQHVVETRSWAMAILANHNSLLITEETLPIFCAYVEWVLPAATKQEQKKPAIDLLVAMYGSLITNEQGIIHAVECANKACASEALMKTIYKAMAECDKNLGLPSPRVKISTRGDDAGKLIIVAPQPKEQTRVATPVKPAAQPVRTDEDETVGDYSPGVCQFCLQDCGQQADYAIQMYRHLLTDCPCCCACPACENIVEIPCLPEHIVFDCACRDKLPYQFDLCPNCRSLVETQFLQEHLQQCKDTIPEEASICPLCGEYLADSEAALIHYSEGNGCDGNPRTAPNLRAVVQQKTRTDRK